MRGARLPVGRRWSGWAWGAIGIVTTFIAITCWWLYEDNAIPFGDAATYLLTIVVNHNLIAEGNVVQMLQSNGIYPPLTVLLGAVATFVGGINATAPILAQNLVYVPILALSCFQLGKRLAGPQAGFLAVAFALGSPLLIEQFHVFMLDAPEAAMVALVVWLVLASERFARVDIAAIAGVATGLALETKEQSAFFLPGLFAVVLLRDGGWRNWRGISAFAAAAFVVGSPWYIARLADLGRIAGAIHTPGRPGRALPALLSISNVGWYFWAVLNGLLFAPLFVFAAVGVARETSRVLKARRDRRGDGPLSGIAPELLGGLFGSWLILSLVPYHDARYAQPLIVYLAVLGTAWIARSPRGMNAGLTTLLLVAVIATTAGASFGFGRQLHVVLANVHIRHDVLTAIPPPDQIRIYSDHDFNIAGPRHNSDDVVELFEGLRREGITGVIWRSGDFETQGLLFLSYVAGLESPPVSATRLIRHGPSQRLPAPSYYAPWQHRWRWNITDLHHAMVIGVPKTQEAITCRTIEGTPVRIERGDPGDGILSPICPTPE